MTFPPKVGLIFAAQMLVLGSCAHRQSVATLQLVPQEEVFDCVAEVVDVKREAWEVRLSAHSYPESVWQGDLTISLRFLSPVAYAGEIRNLGVYEEREIIIGGKLLSAGDVLRFSASESVLQRAVFPEVFSNLRGVSQTENGAKQCVQPTAPSGRG